MLYEIDYTSPETGATSPIDTVNAPEGYTADAYIKECDENADTEWCEMIHRGTITVTPVE